MKLENLRLTWKGLIPVALMALAALAIVAFGVNRLKQVSATAQEIIEKRDAGLVAIVRAANRTRDVTIGVLASIAYDGDAPVGKAADEDFKDAARNANAEFDRAAALLPEHASEIETLKARFAAIYLAAQEPHALGKKAPGVVHGRELTPADIDMLAQEGKLVAPVDLGIRVLSADFRTLNNALIFENAAAARGLNEQADEALRLEVVSGIAATLLVGAFSYWLTNTSIARPLGDIVAKMQALASGQLQVEIDGQKRGDEIGSIARAVDVFKRNALDRIRLEQEATAQRTRAEVETRSAAEERARAAAEQTEAVRRLGAGLRDMASGDLTVRLNDGFSGEYARIRDDFNEAVEKLKETIATVVAATGAIESGARDVTGSADGLSQRTEQQASSLEETSASLTEVTATVQISAEGTRHAREVVAAADQDAKKSAAVVGQAVEAMNLIAKSAQEIGKIIGVIDEIAFQTNLLALNAGVEAARAGDAGKGFAVVASEVRGLAQRSAEAAKEIKILISASDAQVQAGVGLVAETGRALGRIVAKVAQMNAVVAEIANSAQEQSTALLQINAAIEQMSSTTQANAAMVGQSTAAGHSLSQESSRLTKVVAQFRLGAVGGDPRTSRAARQLARAS